LKLRGETQGAGGGREGWQQRCRVSRVGQGNSSKFVCRVCSCFCAGNGMLNMHTCSTVLPVVCLQQHVQFLCKCNPVSPTNMRATQQPQRAQCSSMQISRPCAAQVPPDAVCCVFSHSPEPVDALDLQWRTVGNDLVAPHTQLGQWLGPCGPPGECKGQARAILTADGGSSSCGCLHCCVPVNGCSNADGRLGSLAVGCHTCVGAPGSEVDDL
jgi:hypothetical protein